MEKVLVALVGESGAGKTSFLERIVTNQFIPDVVHTEGVNFKIHPTKHNFSFQFWDISLEGEAKNTYVNRSAITLLFFDISLPNAFENLSDLTENICPLVSNGSKLIIIGNKCDLVQDADLLNETIRKCEDLCKALDAPFYPISVKTGEKIDDAVEKITEFSIPFAQPKPVLEPIVPQEETDWTNIFIWAGVAMSVAALGYFTYRRYRKK